MPHFSSNGNDNYICQECGNIYDSIEYPPVWRPITGKKISGNVCPDCVNETGNKANVAEPPMSLYDHCKEESGLTDPRKIKEYMNRYYGHN